MYKKTGFGKSLEAITDEINFFSELRTESFIHGFSQGSE